MRVLVSRGSRVQPAQQQRASQPGADPEATLKRGPAPAPERLLVTPRPDRAAERAAAARRRIVLYVLLGVTLFCGLVAIAGVLPWWSFVLPLMLIGAFLVVARQSVKRANAPYWVEVPVSEHDDSEPTIGITATQRAAAAAPAAPRVANGATLWDPVPVTLPTYVDAPVARRAFRTITLGSGSTAAAMQPAAPAPIAEVVEEDVPQAVNG